MTPRNDRLTFYVLLLALLTLLPGFKIVNADEMADDSGESTPVKNDKEEEKKMFSDIAPDATVIPGLIPLYRQKETLYAELNSSHLDTDYIVVISIAHGIGSSSLYTGQAWRTGDDILWQFRKVDDRIQIVRRNYRYTAESGTPEASAVMMDYADSILYSLPILAAGPSGGDIVDLTGVFLSDLPGISSRALPGFSFARDRSTWGTIKGKNDRLTDNIEIEVNAAYTGGNNNYEDPLVIDRKGVAVTVHYSISKLPSSGYNPRLADERVGYFTTAVKNMSKNADDGNFIRYINRWNLRKLEPNAEYSLPKKPIVFWLEKTIPYAYRKPIRDGILEWNQAFEEAGFYNAIEVRQQEENDDWDPEDINYNTIRWSETGLGFSIGPSRVNPLTGEILDADIVLDVGFINSWNKELELYSPSELALELCGRSTATEALRRTGQIGEDAFYSFEERTPLFNDRLFMSQQMGVVNTFFEVMLAGAEGEETTGTEEPAARDEKKETQEKEEEVSEEKTSEEQRAEGEKREEVTTELSEETGKETVATEEESAEEKKAKYESLRNKLLRQGLTFITMHELGHTLGLRHNFRGSALHTLDEINAPEQLGKYGFSASVMDYLPVNLVPEGEKQGDYYPTHLGEYDYWVIRYGYKPLGDSTDGDKCELQKIAAEQAKPQYSYAEDYDCYFNSDPFINTFDLGSDPLQYAQTRVRLFKQILPGLTDRIVHEGESYSKLAPRLTAIIKDYLQAMELAVNYIGGIHLHRDFKGDENARPPFVVVSAEKQRQAMKFLTDELFSTEPFVLPPNLTNYLTPNLWLHWGTASPVRQDEDLHGILLDTQKYILWDLLDPSKLSRMADTAMRVGEEEDLFTIAEMFESLTGTIFSELDHADGSYDARHPLISSQRRYLQREYFSQLRSMSLGKPYGWGSQLSFLSSLGILTGSTANDDIESLARKQLRDIRQKINALDATPLDPATGAHLDDLKAQIKGVFRAKVERAN